MKTIRELYREGRYNLWDKNRTAIESYKIDERLEEFMKSLTPKDRRILDEIAGVADFDRRIEQAVKELDVIEKRIEKLVTLQSKK